MMPAREQAVNEVAKVMDAMTDAWRSGRPIDMMPFLHPDIVMTFPGFTGLISGRSKFIEGFEEFCTNARVLEYAETDREVVVIGGSAVASFRFDMLYERPKYRERSTGRDVWVFHRENDRWIAVWRTMVDLHESREEKI